MSRFYFSWFGNKRTELSKIFDAVNMDDFDTIVEPFCGSGALMLECYARYGDTKKYVFNDTDVRLISMLNFIKANGSQPLYDYCANKLNAEDWKTHQKADLSDPYNFFYWNRVKAGFHRGSIPTKWPSLKRNNKVELTDKCFMSDSTSLTGDDWTECVNKYKDDPKALIFIDPPYFNSFNQEYYGIDEINKNKMAKDITTIFMDLLNYMETGKCCLISITNSFALLDHVFKKFIHSKYVKTYNIPILIDKKWSKKTTNHIVICNILQTV